MTNNSIGLDEPAPWPLIIMRGGVDLVIGDGVGAAEGYPAGLDIIVNRTAHGLPLTADELRTLGRACLQRADAWERGAGGAR